MEEPCAEELATRGDPRVRRRRRVGAWRSAGRGMCGPGDQAARGEPGVPAPRMNIVAASLFVIRRSEEHRCGSAVRRRTTVPHRCSRRGAERNIDVAAMFAAGAETGSCAASMLRRAGQALRVGAGAARRGRVGELLRGLGRRGGAGWPRRARRLAVSCPQRRVRATGGRRAVPGAVHRGAWRRVRGSSAWSRARQEPADRVGRHASRHRAARREAGTGAVRVPGVHAPRGGCTDPHRAPVPGDALRRHTPKARAQCGNPASWDRPGGPPVTAVPAATGLTSYRPVSPP